MALNFQNIAHSYGDTQALRDITFTAPSGQITCLLGPSGCGKTTLLKLAAGLLPVQSGSIHLNAQSLADEHVCPPPEKRPIGLVFQEGALFPHLNVADNIAFGVKQIRKSRARKSSDILVSDLLRQMGLSDYGARFPHELSGGQRQRVALARAIAPQPEVLLLDEPFANVDIVLRRRLRSETRRLLRDRNVTALLVTHDPEEAMEIADIIVVMEAGLILQVGTPSDIYDQPQSVGVGSLFGDGQIISAKLDGISAMTDFGTWSLEDIARSKKADLNVSDLLIRPDAVSVSLCEKGVSELIIEDIRFMSAAHRASIRHVKGERLWVRLERDHPFKIGDRVKLQAVKGRIRSF